MKSSRDEICLHMDGNSWQNISYISICSQHEGSIVVVAQETYLYKARNWNEPCV